MNLAGIIIVGLILAYCVFIIVRKRKKSKTGESSWGGCGGGCGSSLENLDKLDESKK